MEQAIADGAADLIGLGRPMCVMTNAPSRLLSGTEELPRYESQLALLPNWLSAMTRIKTVRSVATFAVQYWFYAQLDLLGKVGAANQDLSVMAAARRVLGLQKRLLKG